MDVCCRYVKNGEQVTMVRQEKQDDGVEWSWIRSAKGDEGYILRARLQERRLQSAIFDSVAENEWFFHLVHVMAESAHADKVHGIIVLLLSASLSCDQILHSFVLARPSSSIVDILSAGLESCAVAAGSCATIKVLLRVLHCHMLDGGSRIDLHVQSWLHAARRVLNCMYTNLFQTEPVTPLVLEELAASFEFLQRLLSWSVAERAVIDQLLPSSAFSKRKAAEDVTFLAALQHLLHVIAVGGTGGGLSRAMTARVEPALHQVALQHASAPPPPAARGDTPLGRPVARRIAHVARAIVALSSPQGVARVCCCAQEQPSIGFMLPKFIVALLLSCCNK
jgi:hypothetical protein